MSETDINTGGIVRWEILKGLPGEGPVPKYFHLGHPTPWSEGFVVRFWNSDGAEWVGNFQSGRFGHTEVTLWPEANAVSVIAGEYFYLIEADNPDSYCSLGSQCLVSSTAFDEQRQMLLVAEHYCVCAYDLNRRLLWKKGPGGYINRIVSCLDGVATVEIEPEMGDPLEMAQISTAEESVDDRRYLDILVDVLKTRSEVERLDPGLSDSEVQAVERRFKFTFPPDLRGILQFVLPIGKDFPNWRGDLEDLLRRFDAPFEGICYDAEHNDFWLLEWGAKPSDSQVRREILRKALYEAPRLIPIYAHRYIPNVPYQVGNPVFSVHQTDIIHYGNDLADYFHREFGVPLPEWAARKPRPIQFWEGALRWRSRFG